MRIVLAISPGDPAGVGPELVARAVLGSQGLPTELRPVVFGDGAALRRACALVGADPQRIVELPGTDVSGLRPGELGLVQVGPPLEQVEYGAIRQEYGRASFEWFRAAVEAAAAGAAAAVMTGPICKQSWAAAGIEHAGHTGWLAERFGVEAVMLLYGPRLAVAPLTVHVPLRSAAGLLTRELVRSRLRVLHRALIADFGIPRPHIALAGLNPHAGEGGSLGREELDVLAPVVNELREEGIDVVGPLAADGLFPAAVDGGFDVVACPTHDQALIPFKLLGMFQGVNVTLGLPIVRTSPTHGTALDLAGSGRADPGSLRAALLLAGRLASRRGAT